MDERSPGRIQAKVLGCLFIAAAVLVWGCHKGPYRVFKAKGGEFTCEIPSDWQDIDPPVRKLFIGSPDDVEMLGASFSLRRRETGETIETLTEIKDGFARYWAHDKTYSQEPLAMVKVGEFQGISDSSTRMEVHERTGGPGPADPSYKEWLKKLPPKPKPVLYKETFVYFDTPGGHYVIQYHGPLVLYDKYLPAFEHLLKTFRWTKKT